MIYLADASAMLALAAMIAVTFAAWPRLPASIPTGYNFRSGVPIRWGDRRMLWAGPAVVLMMGIIGFDMHGALGAASAIWLRLFIAAVAGYCAATTWFTAEIARQRRERLPGILNPAAWIIAVMILSVTVLRP